MKFPGRWLFSLLLGGSLALVAAGHAADDPLAWPEITSQTKPWAWWWWHGSAVDTTNLARELREFHDAGLGGVQVTTIYGVQGEDACEIPYLSPKWLDLLGYTVGEASRLGLGVDMTLGSGWCFGGPTVSRQDANASVVVKTLTVPAGEKLPEKFDRATTQALVAYSSAGKVVELTDKISAAGTVDWAASADSNRPWTVYAISQKPSGQKVKRPGPGGEGWMLNPLYPPAMTNWLKWFDAALANYSGPKPQAVFQDSYEYRTDWSPDFFARFEQLRGYKLQDELPALFADVSSITNPVTLDHISRVKYDYRRTVSEIMVRQSEPAWIDWAHRDGFQAIYQAHGSPGNWLDLYGDADLPETEMFHNDRSILISKFASSAAHTQGRAFVGAETGTWLKEHFTVTLADLKYLADDMFLSGVNRIFYHGACYSPADAPWPGWLFYASTEMNPRNPIWRDVPALNAYVARCQSVLQSGQSDNDILLYWPVADFWSQPQGLIQRMAVGQADWFENQPIGRTAKELLEMGYAFDYVSDAQLETAKVVDGKIQMPGGGYKVIVVPQCKFMPLETFRQILLLAENGATVVFEKHLPEDISGWNDWEKQRNEFRWQRSKVEAVFASYISGKNFGNGTILKGNLSLDLSNALIPRETSLSHAGLSFVRNQFAGGWNYFIANRTTTNFDGWITLARPMKSVEVLDAMTGSFGMAAENTANQIHLQLAAGQSVILRALADKKVSGPAWFSWQTNGQPSEISGNWSVKFIAGGPTLPADLQTAKLTSWTMFPETNCQAFAGTTKYAITFDAPERRSAERPVAGTATTAPNRSSALPGGAFFLDLGKVCQSARVTLNGKDYGPLITPPFRVVVDNLKPAGNVLEVEVTSVAANRIRDLDRRGVKWKYFKDINFVNENYRPFNAADWPLTDCGLLGPVTLTPVQASDFPSK